jgi:ATP-dependent DNA ligase
MHAYVTEGLMIKMADSLYHDMRWTRKWIKLKRGRRKIQPSVAGERWHTEAVTSDYIPGLGDTISCCIVGASWTKERGRELRGMLSLCDSVMRNCDI